MQTTPNFHRLKTEQISCSNVFLISDVFTLTLTITWLLVSFYRTTYAITVYATPVSVCPSVTSRYCIKTTGRIKHGGYLAPITHCVIRKFGYLHKIRVLPSGTFSQTPDSENFATESRPRSQQTHRRLHDDGRVCWHPSTTDDLWLFTTSR